MGLLDNISLGLAMNAFRSGLVNGTWLLRLLLDGFGGLLVGTGLVLGGIGFRLGMVGWFLGELGLGLGIHMVGFRFCGWVPLDLGCWVLLCGGLVVGCGVFCWGVLWVWFWAKLVGLFGKFGLV